MLEEEEEVLRFCCSCAGSWMPRAADTSPSWTECGQYRGFPRERRAAADASLGGQGAAASSLLRNRQIFALGTGRGSAVSADPLFCVQFTKNSTALFPLLCPLQSFLNERSITKASPSTSKDKGELGKSCLLLPSGTECYHCLFPRVDRAWPQQLPLGTGRGR